MRNLILVSFLVAAAACGGKKSAATTPDPSGGGDGGRVAAPGTVIGDAAVYAKLKASTIALPAGYDATMQCEGAATLGAAVDAMEKTMAGTINASCDGAKCRVELASPANPECDTSVDVEGCEGSVYLIEFELDGDGAIVPTSLMCMGAG